MSEAYKPNNLLIIGKISTDELSLIHTLHVDGDALYKEDVVKVLEIRDIFQSKVILSTFCCC